jgi:hypothetical protein
MDKTSETSKNGRLGCAEQNPTYTPTPWSCWVSFFNPTYAKRFVRQSAPDHNSLDFETTLAAKIGSLETELSATSPARRKPKPKFMKKFTALIILCLMLSSLAFGQVPPALSVPITVPTAANVHELTAADVETAFGKNRATDSISSDTAAIPLIFTAVWN